MQKIIKSLLRLRSTAAKSGCRLLTLLTSPLISPYNVGLPNECGRVCLVAVLQAFGKRPVDLALLRTRFGYVSGAGMSAGEIVQIAHRFGLAVRAYRVHDVAQLRQMPTPAIVHWRPNHFVLLESWQADGSKISVLDPARGRYLMSVADFSKVYSGVVIIFAAAPSSILIPKVESVT